MNRVQNGKETVWLDAENWEDSCVRRIWHRNFHNVDNINNPFQKCGQVAYTSLPPQRVAGHHFGIIYGRKLKGDRKGYITAQLWFQRL